jgi:hypothetical protein
VKHSPSLDNIRPSSSRDIPCFLRNPKVNLSFCAARRHFVVQLSKSQEFSALKMGPPNCLNGSCPIGHYLPLDPALHPRKIANLRQPKTRRVEVSFTCTQEPATYVCPQPYISSPCLDIVLSTSILLSSYHTRVGLPKSTKSCMHI